MTRLLPGSAIGVLGSGQLGRMFAIAARQMGYRVHTFSPDSDTPTGQVADVEVKASYDDTEALQKFAAQVQAVTFEFENVPSAAVAAMGTKVAVRPAGRVLHITQNRLREKTFLADAGFPVTPFAAIRSAGDLSVAEKKLGFPGVIKTAGFGYDGKGQRKVASGAEAAAAFADLGQGECIYEAFIDFEREVSVVAARGQDGQIVHFGVFHNTHKNHILDVTIAPAEIPSAVEKAAVDVATRILEKLDVVGVMCVEMFLTRDGKVLVNELAPRPHNSGHLTIDACVTSQFEQQVRAVCGLPLGSTAQKRPAAMANLLGDVWSSGTPRWEAALTDPLVKLHLYGKAEPRPGRKMGHLTALGDTPNEARDRVLAARARLTSK